MDISLTVRHIKGALLALVLSASTAALADFRTPYAPENYIADLDNSIENFKTLQGKLEKPENPENTKPLVDEYIQAGLTMSNLACDAWLVTLGKTERVTGFFKNMLNIVGNLILGVAGINGASSSGLARGNLVLGASNAAVDSFQSDFLLGVVSEIEAKVKSGRVIAEQALLEQNLKNYYEAKRRLLEYHDMCTPTAVKNLLKTSLAGFAYAPADTSLTSATNTSRVVILESALNAALYPNYPPENPYLRTGDFYMLWIVKIGLVGATDSKVYKNAEKVLTNSLVLNAFPIETDKQKMVIPLLKQLGDAAGFANRLAVDLAKEQQAAANTAIASSQQKVTQIETELATAVAELQRQNTELEVAVKKLPKPITIPDFKLNLPSTIGLTNRSRSAAFTIKRGEATVPTEQVAEAAQFSQLDQSQRDQEALVATKRKELISARLELERAQAAAQTLTVPVQRASITPVLVPINTRPQ